MKSMKYIGFLLISGILLISCDEFLDEKPDNRVDLNDLDKAAQLLTNAYSDAGVTFTDWMTDDVAYTRGVTIDLEHQQAYEWEDYTGNPLRPDNQDFFWNQTYNAISHANEVLAVLEDLEAVTEEDQRRKEAIESEALLTRAYGHFMLVNLFSKHYDPVRSGSEMGVPWVNEPETVFIKKYSRNSVKEVYDFIEADLLRGIELSDDSFFANSGKYHFNRNAALAFASRFYLYKEDYDKCIEYSTLMLGSDPTPFVRDLTSPEFQNLKSSGTDYTQLYNSPDLPSNLLLIRKRSLFQVPPLGHGPTVTSFGDLIAINFFAGTTDEREFPAFVKGDNGFFPARYQLLFERSGLNSNVGFNYHIHVAFRGEEVLFNRVESFIETNRLDEAIADLQVLVDRRFSGGSTNLSIAHLRDVFGVGNDPFVSDKLVVQLFMQYERRKEFIIQGLRWFDIKRFELEVEHDQIDGSIIRLNDNDRRKVLQLPITAIEVGGLQPNPR